MKNKIINYLNQNNYLENNVLLITIVGSRMWQNEHKNSDWDIFIVINDSLKDMLSINYHPTNKEFKYNLDGMELDIKIKEIRDVLKQLYKNNPNFIFGILSNFILYESNSKLIRELRNITYRNINFQIFPPLAGMLKRNYRKYFVNNTHNELEKKKIIIKKIAWLYRSLSKNSLILDSVIPPNFEYLKDKNEDIQNLELKDLIDFVTDRKFPAWSMFENNIEDFNQFLLNLKLK